MKGANDEILKIRTLQEVKEACDKGAVEKIAKDNAKSQETVQKHEQQLKEPFVQEQRMKYAKVKRES